MSDYLKIEKAIGFIRENINKQPVLEDIASHINLSPYHFQRLFSRWAGVTPKRFLQVLTLEHAKKLLLSNDLSILDTADSIGLSSSSRLYDHFINLEAVTPSEYKQQGEGLTITYGFHNTPYGEAFIAQTSRGICKLDFVDEKTNPLNDLAKQWPKAKLIENIGKIKKTVEIIFQQKPLDRKPLSLWVKGTNFQINVWKALLNIQPGNLVTYSNIARKIGKPKAVRAVGTAIGKNPVGFIIPCHRVIRQTGELGGYRWGLNRKHTILTKETIHSVD